jgi:hypothetical protein
MTETWPEQKARLEHVLVKCRTYCGFEDRMAIKAALARIEELEAADDGRWPPCDEPGCDQESVAGTPLPVGCLPGTNTGYRWTCHAHRPEAA